MTMSALKTCLPPDQLTSYVDDVVVLCVHLLTQVFHLLVMVKIPLYYF